MELPGNTLLFVIREESLSSLITRRLFQGIGGEVRQEWAMDVPGH
jgi:hypothetical protein